MHCPPELVRGDGIVVGQRRYTRRCTHAYKISKRVWRGSHSPTDRGVIEMDVQLIWPTFHLHTGRDPSDRGHLASFSTVVAETPEIDSLSFFPLSRRETTITSIWSRERELSRTEDCSRRGDSRGLCIAKIAIALTLIDPYRKKRNFEGRGERRDGILHPFLSFSRSSPELTIARFDVVS